MNSCKKFVFGMLAVITFIGRAEMNASAQNVILVNPCPDVWYLDWLGTPGEKSSASDVRVDGTVVGSFGGDFFSSRPFKAGRFTGRTDLSPFVGGFGSANAINWWGQIVGQVFVNGDLHAFLLSGTSSTDLGSLPGGQGASASGINFLGQVVGTAIVGITRHAFLWKQDTGMLDLGPGDADAINDYGEIAGSTDTPDHNAVHAFRISNGVQFDVGTLPGFRDSTAHSINNAGNMVGDANTDSLTTHAVLWVKGSPTLIDLSPTATVSSALHINNNGLVVGSSVVAGQSHAVRWQFNPGTGTFFMWDLNSLLPAGSNSVLESATSINDAGQIVGRGIVNGVEQAFILTPVNVKSLQYSSSSVTGGASVQATVSLTNAPSRDLAITISDYHPAASAPSSVSVYGGNTAANFTVNTYFVSSSTTGSFGASLPSSFRYCSGVSASLTVLPLLIKAF
jgi:probable HAF family extracellular repeat protein